MSDLQNQYIDDTFDGLLHANGQPLGSDNKVIYDGSGQASALSLGLAGSGASINGTLSASDLKVGTLDYPSAGSTVGSVAYLASANTLGFTSSLPVSILADSGVVADTYRLEDINIIDINSQGVVTNIDVITNPKQTVKYRYTENPSSSIDDKDWSDAKSYIIDNTWNPITLQQNLTIPPKGAILYLERTNTGALSPNTKTVDIRSSRNPNNVNDDKNIYDPNGHRCFKSDVGTNIGFQFTTSIIAVENSQGFYDAKVYLKDEGINPDHDSKFKIAVQAYLY